MNSRKNLGGELAQWQSRLGQGGRQYWQSLEELAESEAFAAVVRQE
ncbi:MAG: TAT-variant-translocated molybdopterin oxidoreductase, partial [Planctomycetia bacterium]|nr:TAT-variant-translocated molybdopterin oxidoreductase [Planctomycetia bacterium]